MSVPHRDDEPDDPRETAGPGERTSDGAGGRGGSGASPDDPSAAPGEPRDDEEARAREAAAWDAIVASYGERPDWEELAGDADASRGRPHRDPAEARPHPDHPAGRGPELRGEEEPDLARGPEERFVPPPTGPLPRVAPKRLLAWAGLFGVPALVLVLLLAGVDIASWAGTLLLVWFVGGFVYLVASMRRDRGDDPDDGAVV